MARPGRSVHLAGDLADHDLGDQLTAGDGLPRPRRTRSPARPPPSGSSSDSCGNSTSVMARTSSVHGLADPVPGRQHRVLQRRAYGMGTSGTATRRHRRPQQAGIGLRDGRRDLAGQAERQVVLVHHEQPAGLGAPTASTVSRSSGTSDRRSTTSTSMPSAASSSADVQRVVHRERERHHGDVASLADHRGLADRRPRSAPRAPAPIERGFFAIHGSPMTPLWNM